MKNLAAQALAFQYKLPIDNSTSLINVNNKPLQEIEKALDEMVTPNQKLHILNIIVAENNPKEIDTTESK